MNAFKFGAPAKIHMPGHPSHKTRVTLLAPEDGGRRWRVLVRWWRDKALRANPTVLQHKQVTVPTEQLRLLPGADRKAQGWDAFRRQAIATAAKHHAMFFANRREWPRNNNTPQEDLKLFVEEVIRR